MMIPDYSKKSDAEEITPDWRSFCDERFLYHRELKIIRDTKTGLDWFLMPEKNPTWSEAISWIKSLKNEWHLPSEEQVHDLLQSGVGIPDWKNESSSVPQWDPLKNRGRYFWTKDIDSDESSSESYVLFPPGYKYWSYTRGYSVSRHTFAIRLSSISDNM